MSIRNLPALSANEKIKALQFEPDVDALARWNPAVRAADGNADNSISILDVIGEDFFGDGITSRRVSAALRQIGSRDVVVNINSPGGDFFEGVAIYNVLRLHPHNVTVRILGEAASAAAVIAMAGDEVLIGNPGFLMIHNTWVVAMGDRHDMRAAADMLEPFDASMASLFAARSGKDQEVAAKWLDAETWFNADTAIENGLADGILSADEVVEGETPETQKTAAIRRVDAVLARQGISRSERRALLGTLKAGTHDAAGDDMHDAVDNDLAELIRNAEKAFINRTRSYDP